MFDATGGFDPNVCEPDDTANNVVFGPDTITQKRSRRLHPDEASHRLYSAWLALLPALVPDYLSYLRVAQRRTGGASGKIEHQCCKETCMVEVTSITCIYFDRELNGLFPTAPTQPRMAVSIDLLDFYFALFEKSADAITALAGALKTFYQRRGFAILNDKGEPVQDPFRRGIGYAAQWYDCLRNRVESQVESAVKARARTMTLSDVLADAIKSPPPHTIVRSCDRILQKRCPACFGGTKFGRNFDTDGGDIHVAIDATFSQRHNVAAGDSPWFHEPKYFVSKAEVDAVGSRIDAARKTAPRKYACEVPDAALDECEKSFEAADEKKAKTHGVKFDDTGLMALVCRHDIVLFLANVDTPGEQQKYGIALLEHFMALLPQQATVGVFYDIGCVLSRSLHLYDLLPQSIVERLVFATSVMHAYGHQWSCQLVYNPRLREGLGLTEGEGTERVWSKFRKLIGVTRTSGRSRRIWYLDRHADAVNATAREDLGNWHRSRLKNGVEARSATANKELEELGIALPELRQQWQLQRAAQLSLRNHAPARLKRELDTVLNLQAELDDIQKHVRTVEASVAAHDANPAAHELIKDLQQSHARTMQKVEQLYASLNVPDDFPELRELPLPFVRTLIMARDLKINIRKRAIGSFFEWDKLDRAAGGRDQPLGTKLHQQTRKAISKRTPALLTAIRKFNNYCEELRKQYKKKWDIPLPGPLPVELGTLREDPSLLTDVWITPLTSDPRPRWLNDPDVRRGIRAMLARDRCLEERKRLGEEADNLCRWYGRELAAVELALRTPRFQPIMFLLEQRKAELLLLQARWRTPLASHLRFASKTEEAIRIAERVSGTAQPKALTWVHFTFQDGDDNDDRQDPEATYFDSETVLARDTIEQLISDDDDDDDDDDPTLNEDVLPRPAPYSSSAPASPTFSWTRNLDIDLFVDHIHFAPADVERLRNPSSWLNDDCINGCIQLLLRYFGGAATTHGNPAFISSFAMSQQRSNKATDESYWRNYHTSRFWEKDMWVFPIHQPAKQHWEVAVVYFQTRRIAYFDSFGDKNSWKNEIKLVLNLVHKLHRLAREHGYSPPSLEGRWCAYPLISPETPLQTNGVDCGVWSLAFVAALIRGYESISISENDIARFRARLLNILLMKTTQAPSG
ncbi:hypothetical protein C8Q76DRAFT_624385 [Earliella scabrosa]|nr:hypothetical protein C8Q76DRAFT_624385 [Earliella scabrosa]